MTRPEGVFLFVLLLVFLLTGKTVLKRRILQGNTMTYFAAYLQIKKEMRSVFILIITLIFPLVNIRAGETDSLKRLIETEKVDTTLIKLRIQLAKQLLKEEDKEGFALLSETDKNLNSVRDPEFLLRTKSDISHLYYRFNNHDEAIGVLQQSIPKARILHKNKWVAEYYNAIAEYKMDEGQSSEAIPYYDSALMLISKNEAEWRANVIRQKGRAYYDLADYKNAMDLYLKSKDIFEKHKLYNKDYGHLLHYIGSVFKRQKDYDKALEYYEQELKLAHDLKDLSVEAEALYLCASMYGHKGDLEKELEYCGKSLKLFEETGSASGVALMKGNIAGIYADMGDIPKAMEYTKSAMTYYEKEGDGEKMAWSYSALGNYQSDLGHYAQAMQWYKKALQTTETFDRKKLLMQKGIKYSMSFTYAKMNDFRNAFYTFLDYTDIKDSIENAENKEYLRELESKYNVEKKDHEIAMLNKDKQMQEAEIARKDLEQNLAAEQHRSQRNFFIGGLIFLFVVLGVAAYAYFTKRKSNQLLNLQLAEINRQNLIIAEKNKDITDSIQYARRIQEAVLPPAEQLNEFFRDSFVFYRPKDIVSGDFYWFNANSEQAIIAVGDCTGHGVPGAFMSIIGHDLLNQIVLEEAVHQPREILRLLDIRVSTTLNKRGQQQEYQDGMDIAICHFDKKSSILTFSGANRPLIIKRNADIIELSPNKFPVGGNQDETCKVFYQHEIELSHQDITYLFSDGYADQFGGTNGKKFKYQQLKMYLKNITTDSFPAQLNNIAQVFDNWKGELEQVDDVCVIGVKL